MAPINLKAAQETLHLLGVPRLAEPVPYLGMDVIRSILDINTRNIGVERIEADRIESIKQLQSPFLDFITGVDFKPMTHPLPPAQTPGMDYDQRAIGYRSDFQAWIWHISCDDGDDWPYCATMTQENYHEIRRQHAVTFFERADIAVQ